MELFAYRCENCNTRVHPKPCVCAVCGGRNFHEEPLTGTVTLLTHTRVYNLPEGIEKPYLDFGIVEFENGVRVTGRLEVTKEARTGMKLQATVGVVRKVCGEEKYGYIFKEQDQSIKMKL